MWSMLLCFICLLHLLYVVICYVSVICYMSSNSLKYINLTGVSVGLVVPLRGPMSLRGCVSEKHGDGEGTGS